MYRLYLSNDVIVECKDLRTIYHNAIAEIIEGASIGENQEIEIINVDNNEIVAIVDCIYFKSRSKGYIFVERGWHATYPVLVRVFRGGLKK